MTKKNSYICGACGAPYPKWVGRCESCGEWNSIVSQACGTSGCAGGNKSLTSIQSMHSMETNCCRSETGYREFDKILGGGIVNGSVILVGGEPGVGKSTLITQIAININDSLYISAEESIEQISLRIKRMPKTNNNTLFASTAKLEDIISFIESSKARFVLIDSIQTIYSNNAPSTPGSITQVRYCAHKLIEFAKSLGVTLLIISHVNKDGQIAGPKVLEHMVDTVLYFEGDAYNHHRILRTVKNRFGPANEIAVFSMRGSGLQEISNPSSAFISEHANSASGSVIFAGIEGTRPILLEIQALLSPTYMATPRRAVVGWDINRLAMIAAILNTRCGIFLSNKEIYLNVAGGFKITETAADMAVAAALISAALNKIIPPKTIVFGEISLSGSSRKAQQSEKRLQESQRLGFCNAIVPSKENSDAIKFQNMIAISHIGRLKSYIEQL